MSNKSPQNGEQSTLALLSTLRPFGSLTVCTVTGTIPALALAAALAEIQNTAERSHQATSSNWRRSELCSVGPKLSAISLEWEESRPVAAFTDDRRDVHHRYAIVATNGTHLALSTNSISARRRFTRWIKADRQGYVGSLADRTFREVAAGQTAIAAWLRNTTPHRGSQFAALAVAGSDVGEGALASEMSSYLAKTVRVQHNVDKGGEEDVTVNPAEFKLTFRRTDQIESWAELVNVAFAWIATASTPRKGLASLLPGTAEILDSFDGVGEPYDVVLPIIVPDLLDEDHDEEFQTRLPVRIEVQNGQRPEKFMAEVIDGDVVVGRCLIRLVRHGDRIEHEVAFIETGIPSLAGAVRTAIEAHGIEVHFTSEHLYAGGVLSYRPVKPAPFRGYDWEDFAGVGTIVTNEKPSNTPTMMRALLGTPADTSLFGWVVQTRTKGWLVCDDGANETSDFIHLTDDDLTLLPIKAALKKGRSTSTEAIELVQAQAAKNLGFLDDLPLLHRVLTAHTSRLVVFRDAVRQDDSVEFLASLARVRPALIRRSVVIIQPQLRERDVKVAHSRVDAGRRANADLGMMRIDQMLRTLDEKCARRGISLKVLGQR
jgi:hypothetical protein